MFAKPMFSMLVWSYYVTGHLNFVRQAASTSTAAKIGGTGHRINGIMRRFAKSTCTDDKKR
jgi:hypothetical protein